jgi:hypothetical protein
MQDAGDVDLSRLQCSDLRVILKDCCPGRRKARNADAIPVGFGPQMSRGRAVLW